MEHKLLVDSLIEEGLQVVRDRRKSVSAQEASQPRRAEQCGSVPKHSEELGTLPQKILIQTPSDI